jgi:hypothetical protein
VTLVPLEEEDEEEDQSPFVGLLKVEADQRGERALAR